MGILDILSGGLGSGIIGAAGGIATAVLQARQRKADQAHELAMAPLRNAHDLALREADLKAIQAEAALKVEQIREQGEADAAVRQADVVMASYQHDASLRAPGSWVMRHVVDPLAAAVRPVLTVFFAVVVGYVAWSVVPRLAPLIANDPAKGWDVLAFILDAANMTFAWWFAARMVSARGKGR